MAPIVTLLIAAATLVLALALAYLPMRLLLGQLAKGVQQLIQRQRDRRTVERGSPDRRKAPTS